jgi:phosphatidate cytidylyltransferase
MPEHNPTAGAPELSTKPESSSKSRNLMLRVVSSAVLAPVAVGAVYLGGWAFAAFWTIAAIAVWWEWTRLVHPAGHLGALITGASALLLEAFLLLHDRDDVAVMIAGLGALAAAIVAARHAFWMAAGVVYASILVIAPIMIRGSAEGGFLAIVFVFAVVWATDIAAYFTGRAIGGPKLAPSVSPNKTWSGAVGGTIAAALAGCGVLLAAGNRASLAIVLVAVVLSVMSQAGDLFESRMKRIFNVKDSSQLIPGHGGVMDRLDGFTTAVFAALVIGVVHGGWNSPAQGLIGW